MNSISDILTKEEYQILITLLNKIQENSINSKILTFNVPFTTIEFKYQEFVDKNKLDELADKLNPNNPHGDNYEVGQYFGFQDGFCAGYHKAKEEQT